MSHPPPPSVWRTLTGRVSIKQGSTMKKIGGPKGQVGGGQQGEVRLNGNSSDVGCVCCVRGLHTGKRGGRVCFRGCAGTYSVAFPLVSDPKCERRRLPSHPSLPPSLSLSLSLPLFSQFFCCFSSLFAFNTCSSSGAVSQQTLPRLHLGKDFTVKGHRLRLSNKQSGTGEPTTHTFTPVFSLCLLIS